MVLIDSSQEAFGSRPETKKKTSPSDYVVLAIDDSNTDRAIMKKCLKTLGVTVLEAANGQDGLDIVKNGDKHLDAVLVDIENEHLKIKVQWKLKSDTKTKGTTEVTL